MKKALIMGITGGFGGHVAQALVEHGWSLRVLMRDPAKLPLQFRSAEVVTGNAAHLDDVRQAAKGVDLMVYAVNPANYQWEGKVLPWLDNAATVAEENRLTMVFPGNVYVFDPADGPEFDERAPLQPVSSKGNMRAAMEERLKLAAQRGAKVIVIRCGDFIGINAYSAWIQQLVKRNSKGYALYAPGPVQLPHTWAFLPDAAQTVAELVDSKDELHGYNMFHFKGYQVSFNEMAQIIGNTTGRPVALKKFPWWAVRLIAPFSTLFRSLIEMRYLWNNEVNLADDKLRATLGNPVPHTPLAEALVQSGVIQATRENTHELHHGRALF